ncbi:hypothetical protein KAW38_03315 [Candidatus Micrarchaeota archaeon]|nr:hypothetical protein [Candidatus Micrarchaeota archaeon]
MVNNTEKFNRKNTLWHKAHIGRWELLLLNGAYIGIYKDVQKAFEQGVNPFVKDENGLTALQLANREGHKEIAELIKRETDSFLSRQEPIDKKQLHKPKQFEKAKTLGKKVNKNN